MVGTLDGMRVSGMGWDGDLQVRQLQTFSVRDILGQLPRSIRLVNLPAQLLVRGRGLHEEIDDCTQRYGSCVAAGESGYRQVRVSSLPMDQCS
jgi:hypothetical protein